MLFKEKAFIILGSHRITAGFHIAQLFCQNATGLALTPVCCSMKRRPAIKIHS